MSVFRVYITLAAAFTTGAVAGSLRLQAQSTPASIPTPAQAQDLMQKRPELLVQLRQRIESSGLTRDQIKARLRAAGYSESLLDQIFAEGGTAGRTAGQSDSLIAAARALGLVSDEEAPQLQRPSGTPDADATTRAAGADRTRTGDSYAPDGSTPFGLALFAQQTTLFDPNVGGPVDASYRLGAGDQLVLILSGDVEAAYTLDVTREGFVAVPVVGTIPVASLTLGQLETLLRSRLARVYSGIGSTTRFSVSVARLRSNQVFVAGDVQQPGSYRISSAGTALSALYAAGGPGERGSLRRIEIRRRGAPAQRLDVYDYLVRGDASGDPRLEQGDVIFVPAHGPRVRIFGGVLRPATYELRDGESLADLITAAGGFSDDASQRRLRIERIVPASQRTAEGSDRIVLDVTVPAGSGAASAVRLEAGDIVEVPRVADRVRRRVTVKGNVWQPGVLGIQTGDNLTDVLRRVGGLKPDTYLGRVIVTRLRGDSTREQIAVALRDLDGNTAAPIEVKDDDEITVYATTAFRAERHVALTGAVKRPGRYPWREGITMRDLVLEAGGLLPSALLTEAEIARLPEQREEGRLSRTFRVAIDSSYRIEDGAAPRGPDVVLQPFDNVLILRQPDWQLQSLVTLAGEVKFPGVYALTSKNERLSDLLARAGGLTTAAYPAGVEFIRGREGARVGIDLPLVMRNPKDRDNLLLQDKDSIFIPRYNALVTVTGAVNSNVSVPYEPGAPLSHYINAAGGYTRLADSKRTYVQQSNGKVVARSRQLLVFSSIPKPTPGSRIVVPARDPAEKRDLTQLLGTVTQVLGSLVTIAVVLSRTTN